MVCKNLNKENKYMLSIIIVLLIVIIILGIYIYNKHDEYNKVSENSYNKSFFELINYVQNVEIYLAKALISSSSEQGAETLSNVWREANLAGAFLSQLPINSHELEKTSKFLNQVSDYSYSLSRKNIKRQKLSNEDMKNLKELHQYSIDLKNTLHQLSSDMNEGRISWKELSKTGNNKLLTDTNNISKDSFNNLEENFHRYSGLIYDGAFSEHIETKEKKGLTGNKINEEEAYNIASIFVGKDKIEEIKLSGKNENGNIISYDFNIKLRDKNRVVSVSVAEKGGHIIHMNADKEISAENVSKEDANKIGLKFLESKGFKNMKETYYLKQNGIVTINYAYLQDGVTIYPDLIKLKIALDDGEVLGMETSGYLNSHFVRDIPKVKISKEEARKNLNKDLEITSEGLAIIPTEWQTEIFCWEFKGKIDDMDFIVYINTETGEEEDILLIINTPDGTLTH